MTEQRDRVTTDPGLGPIDVNNTATLRSIENAVEVEPDGASYYYAAKPLVAVSDHRTLEMQTVKLSDDIDPRKRPTELSLPRSPTPPRYDSGWPHAEVVLTSSQRPAPLRRWRVPAMLLALLGGLLLLVSGRALMQRLGDPSGRGVLPARAAASLPLEPEHPAVLVVRPRASVTVAPPKGASAEPSAASPSAIAASGTSPSAIAPTAAVPVVELRSTASASTASASTAANQAPGIASKPAHLSSKPVLQSSASAPLSAPVPTKPRAIY